MENEVFVLQHMAKREFWSKVRKLPGNGCWLWLGHINNGYGEIKKKGIRAYAHRVSWLIRKGRHPKSKCVLHKCDVRRCVRHLFLGTRKENNEDRDRKGRMARGERQWLSVLTAKKVLEIRKRYAAGETNKSELAREYKVNNTLIGFVIRRHVWKHI